MVAEFAIISGLRHFKMCAFLAGGIVLYFVSVKSTPQLVAGQEEICIFQLNQ